MREVEGAVVQTGGEGSLTASERHRAEIASGARFAFGRNWARFLRVLNDDRIALAERSLQAMLGIERLDGLTFLDIGSGSGLFSLCARRLGAAVHSFDYDPQSVACTRELKRRYFAGDSSWAVEQGSVLDGAYLDRLGTFDIVYAWGVLHHTGQMWQALDNVKPLVRMGGKLFIAVYNDLGDLTDRWARIKQTYVRLPAPAARLYAVAIVAATETRRLAGHLRRGEPGVWLRSWTDYARHSTRGMSRWHDELDWIGGFPYERATIEQVVDRYAADGFRLVNLVDRSNGTGCNEFVFAREAPLGTWVESPIPGGSSLVRRFGHRVLPPFERTGDGWTGAVRQPVLPAEEPVRLWLFESDTLTGPAQLDAAGRIVVAPVGADGSGLAGKTFHVVAGEVRRPSRPFVRVRGRMWIWEAGDLEHEADTMTDGARSTVFVLEDGRQLDRPHAVHDDIAKRGDGRFSHWGKGVYFALRGNRDPRREPERLALFVPAGGSGKSGCASASSAAAAPRAPSSRSSPLAALRARYPGVRGAVSVLLRRNRLARRLQPLLDRREEGVLATLQTPGDFPFRISRPVARRVLMGSGALHGGGAERQIVNAIEGLRARGVDDVHLLVQFLDPGDSNAFYLDKAAKAAKSIVRPADRDYGSHPWMLQHGAFRSVVSDGLASQVLCSAETIAGLSPEVVHCSLDWPNVVIGMAAVLAGVPHVFLSGRNLSPRHFWFFRWFMYPCYRALAAHPAVRLLNNSEAGRDDYAGWLRLPREKIRVLRNGLQPEDFVPAGDGDRTAARRQLGLPADAKVVAGAFRLSSEKRPLLWLEAAARIKATLPDAVFLHCGAGPMQARFEARAHRLGLGGSVRLLGARKDIQTVLAAADVVLQTSLQEGTPNTLIEAQAMGVPVVTTPACGAREAVAHSVTGTVVHDDRAATLSAAVLAILSDAAMAGRMRQSGPAFVESRFGFQRMIDDTLGAFAAAGVAWAAEHMQPTTCPAART